MGAWAEDKTSLDLHFLICKTGRVTTASQERFIHSLTITWMPTGASVILDAWDAGKQHTQSLWTDTIYKAMMGEGSQQIRNQIN